GSRENDKGPQNQFLGSDLDFIANEGLGSLAAVTRQYITTLRQQPQHTSAAIGFLNEVVDRALAQMLDLGGVSISDLFIAIRKELLADGRERGLEDGLELVLLVEDFAV